MRCFIRFSREFLRMFLFFFFFSFLSLNHQRPRKRRERERYVSGETLILALAAIPYACMYYLSVEFLSVNLSYRDPLLDDTSVHFLASKIDAAEYKYGSGAPGLMFIANREMFQR